MPDYLNRKTVLDTIRSNAMLRVLDIYDAVERLPVSVVDRDKPTPSIIPCSECDYYREDAWKEVDGVPVIVAHNVCIRWGDGCVTDPGGFCHLAEKKGGKDTDAPTKPYDLLYEEGGSST